MLWGFLNTLQIISYFAFLNLYMPDFLSEFIESLAIANFNIELGFVDDAIDDFQNYWIGNYDYDLYTEDDTYEDNGIESLSILRNASRIMFILSQGLFFCMILYALKAKFVTIESPSLRENYHDSEDSKARILTELKITSSQKSKDRVNSTPKWLQIKIVEM